MSTVWRENVEMAQEYIPGADIDNLVWRLEAENLKLKSEIEKCWRAI